MVMRAQPAKKAEKVRKAWGNIVMTILTVAYPPIPVIAAARIVLIGVGASAYADGSQTWSPNWPIFTKNPKHIAATIPRRRVVEMSPGFTVRLLITRFISVASVRYAVTSIPTRRTRAPTWVQMKYVSEILSFSPYPHSAMRKKEGTSIISKKR